MTRISPSINKLFWTAANNNAILTALLQHEEDKFLKLTVKIYIATNPFWKKVDQISSEMIGTIAISSPLEDNADISRDAQLALALQKLEEDEL